MIVCFVYGLPRGSRAGEVSLMEALILCLAEVYQMDQANVTVFFPEDRIQKGLGEELIATVKLVGLRTSKKERLHALELIGNVLTDFAVVHLVKCQKIVTCSLDRDESVKVDVMSRHPLLQPKAFPIFHSAVRQQLVERITPPRLSAVLAFLWVIATGRSSASNLQIAELTGVPLKHLREYSTWIFGIGLVQKSGHGRTRSLAKGPIRLVRLVCNRAEHAPRSIAPDLCGNRYFEPNQLYNLEEVVSILKSHKS